MQNPESGLVLEDLRQASFHYQWMELNRGISLGKEDLSVIVVSSRKRVEPEGAHAVGGLFIMPQSELVVMASQYGNVLDEALRRLRFASYDEARKFLAGAISQQGFSMEGIKKKFTTTKVSDLPSGRDDKPIH